MSQEHGPIGPSTPEQSKAELEAMAQERLKDLSEQSGERPDEGKGDRVERAREQLKKHEVAAEPVPAAEKSSGRPTFTARLDRALNYSQTLASVQRRLKPASRNFSKVIHAPAVEKVSEAMEKTVMRPSVTLGATWTALILGLLFYTTARRYGWSLSSFELVGSLIVGGIIGYALEVLANTLRNRHQ